MKKVLIFVVIFAAAIFLTGCGQQQTVGKTFIGGTDGLQTTFLPGSPPDKTTDGHSGGFSIVVKMINAGEADIASGDGYVQIWGLDPNTYSWTATPNFKQNFNPQNGFANTLRGAVKNFDGSVLNGGTTTVEFSGLQYMPTITGDLQQQIWANICYRYSTKVVAQICAKSTTEQALNNAQICQVEGEKNPQNSGAPIQVTSLKESYAGNKQLGVTLTIAHVGKGDNFFKDSTTPDCNDVETNTDRGKVKVTFKDVGIGGQTVPVKCQGLDADGYVRLFTDSSGKATTTVYCTIDTSSSNTVVEVPLEATLNYVYLQHIAQDITIRHISQ